MAKAYISFVNPLRKEHPELASMLTDPSLKKIVHLANGPTHLCGSRGRCKPTAGTSDVGVEKCWIRVDFKFI